MSDFPPSSERPDDVPDTAEAVFARIQRRRAEGLGRPPGPLPGRASIDPASAETEPWTVDPAAPAASSTPHVPAREQASPDGMPASGAADSASHRNMLPVLHASARQHDDAEWSDADPGFPRSKTFRTIIRHPGLTLLALLPVAQFALRSRTVQRTAAEIGKFVVKQQMWKHVRRFTD